MAKVDILVDQVSAFLFEKVEILAQEQLQALVMSFADMRKVTYGDKYSPEEMDAAVAAIQTRHTTSMGMGVLFYDAREYKPWLDDKRSQITFYYWKRYHKHLKEKYPRDVVGTLHDITDTVLDHLEDPEKEGGWERRGLVVGHVQSGKTANYIGLIAKAADTGYKIIIVLGGLLNSLRNQTQARIDADFSGWCTRHKNPIGVSRFDDTPLSPRHPTMFTTSVHDFKKALAQQVALGLDALTEPVLLVIKKNVTTLRNLREWLTQNNRHNLKDFPLLLIDDEADHASINTNKADLDPTKINLGIRELLKLFPRSAYVGYTATPFANIFIDPETETEMTGGELYKDLFPRDFIFSLGSPGNYVGAYQVFVDDEQSRNFLRIIDDNEDYLPVKHTKDFEPLMAPSLERAIDCFILAKAIRELRGHTGKHHSMMINVSRFTNIQQQLKVLVSAFVQERKDAIRNYAGLSETVALNNSILREFYCVWNEEYADAGFSWGDVQRQLNTSVSSIKVISVNVQSTDALDYSDFPNGRSLIAIGGLGLSRGLTLEGLSVSYFLRNSQMYDTLLQMGRWFGYRDEYSDLCRIYMPEYAASWYAYIAEAVEELRGEFCEMAKLRLTPSEFGLKVRRHPSALMVTARNKRGTAQTWVRKIDLEGRFAETSRLINDDATFNENAAVFVRAVNDADKVVTSENSKFGWLWRGVPIAVLEMVVENFKNAPDCLLTTKTPLKEYIGWLKTQKGVATCDVLLRSKQSGNQAPVVCAGYSVIPAERLLENHSLDERRLTFIKRHISSRGDEQAGLSESVVNAIQANFGGKNVPDKEYRKYRSANGMPPLLILVFASVAASEKASGRGKQRQQVGERKVVPAYGISFPGDPGSRKSPEKSVSYEVNATWLRNCDEWTVHEGDYEIEDVL